MQENSPKPGLSLETPEQATERVQGAASATPSVMDNLRTAQASGDPVVVEAATKAADEEYMTPGNKPSDAANGSASPEDKEKEYESKKAVFYQNLEVDINNYVTKIRTGKYPAGQVPDVQGREVIYARTFMNPEDLKDFESNYMKLRALAGLQNSPSFTRIEKVKASDYEGCKYLNDQEVRSIVENYNASIKS